MDRVRNEEVSRGAEVERELASRGELGVLRRYGHIARTDEQQVAERVKAAAR